MRVNEKNRLEDLRVESEEQVSSLALARHYRLRFKAVQFI